MSGSVLDVYGAVPLMAEMKNRWEERARDSTKGVSLTVVESKQPKNARSYVLHERALLHRFSNIIWKDRDRYSDQRRENPDTFLPTENLLSPHTRRTSNVEKGREENRTIGKRVSE